jgi:hypothetical protein
MAEPTIREPDQIRRDCAHKLEQIETSELFTEILACLLDEDWTTPRIQELCVTSDRHLLARKEGGVGFDLPFAGRQCRHHRLERRPHPLAGLSLA